MFHCIIDGSLSCVSLNIMKTTVVEADAPVNHIVIIDCSGSMSGELPKIRAQLKKKLPKIIGEQDTLSIIWFSGKKQFGTLIENEAIPSLADLKTIENAIDRWLKPVGLTGFKEPLEEAKRLIERICIARPSSVNNLFFMSDGQDNQWSAAEILGISSDLSSLVASSTFVEYGYYADRKLLTGMAEKSGGSLIFAEDFDKFTPVLESMLSKKIKNGKKIEVNIPGDPIGGFVYSLVDNEILTFAVSAGRVYVPEYVDSIYYLSPSPSGLKRDLDQFHPALYAALSLYSVRMKSDVILSILKCLGDVRFIDNFAGLFGKQAYSNYMDAAKSAAFDDRLRFVAGRDFNRIPRSDSFTVMEFLRILASDPSNKILLDHESFKYNKIGRSKVDASLILSESEQDEINALTEEMSRTKDAKKVAEIAAKISLISTKPEALKFTSNSSPEGYSVANLTFNEDRPNVSILVKKHGSVDLSSRNPPAEIPKVFDTLVYRNYTVIKDGLVNINVLPVRLSDSSTKSIQNAISDGRAKSDTFEFKENYVLIHLSNIPVINRNMIKDISAQEFFSKCYALTKYQAEAKVFNAVIKELFPKKSTGFETLYGEPGTAWLKDNGFTEHSGFSPKSIQAESTDFYMGKELKVSLKGLSSLPSLKVARENIAKNKINAPTALMKKAILEIDDYNRTNPNQEDLEKWLSDKARDATESAKSLIREIAEVTFTIIVGQVWFKEFSGIEENSLSIEFDGSETECKVEMREVEIKI